VDVSVPQPSTPGIALERTDSRCLVDDLCDELGATTVGLLERSNCFNRIIGYLAEASLRKITVTLAHAFIFTDDSHPPDIANDPLHLKPGEASLLALLIGMPPKLAA
jgi:hypothetical protein